MSAVSPRCCCSSRPLAAAVERLKKARRPPLRAYLLFRKTRLQASVVGGDPRAAAGVISAFSIVIAAMASSFAIAQ